MVFFHTRPPASSLFLWLFRIAVISWIAGLAIACKYNAAPFLLIPLLYSAFTLHQVFDSQGWRFELFLISLLVIAIFSAIGFTLLCPYWFEELPVFIEDVLHQVWYFKTGHQDYNTFTPGLQMVGVSLRGFADQYSWVGLLSTIIAAGYLLFTGFFIRDENRNIVKVLLPACAGCLGFFLLMSNQAVFFDRNFSILWSIYYFCCACLWWYAAGEFTSKIGWKNREKVQMLFTLMLTLICIVKANFIDVALFGNSREWWRANSEVIDALKYYF